MMLNEHFIATEKALIYKAKIASNAGHSIHKGTPREIFVREFLADHLGNSVAIGTGEVIDGNSFPGEMRNQIDIIIYRSDYPKISFGGGINAFLVESVVSTIEVKSTLSKEDLLQATETAKRIKQLEKNLDFGFSVGYVPRSTLCYLVAYAGPANISTAYNWLIDANNQLNASPENSNTSGMKTNPGLDGIFILGTGFIYFYDAPVSMLRMSYFEENPDKCWVMVEQNEGILLPLFLFITKGVSGFSKTDFNPYSYLKHVRFSNIVLGDNLAQNVTKLSPKALDETSITVDLAENFGKWNEELLKLDLSGEDSITVDVEKLRQAPSNTFVVHLPLYPPEVNRALRFLLHKLNKDKELEIIAFYRERSMDTPLIAKVVFDTQPMYNSGKTSSELQPPFPAIQIFKK